MHPHFYKDLDKDSMVTTEISMRKLVEQVVDLNYGTQRFLSHLIDVRRERLQARIASHRAGGDQDHAEHLQRRGDPLADEIEGLLRRGLY